ncbi:MAG TPA: SoxR reducing system RseC family protein [Coriobacteriia bacterium]
MSTLDGGVIERGEVVGTGPRSVDVRIRATDACDGCNACSRVDKEGMVMTDVRDDLGAAEGDLVEVTVPEGTDMRAGAYVYLGPVAALLVGYAMGNAVGRLAGWDPDATGAVMAVAGVIAGMLLMRGRARKVLASERFRPKVRAIISRGRRPGAESAASSNGDSNGPVENKETTP